MSAPRTASKAPAGSASGVPPAAATGVAAAVVLRRWVAACAVAESVGMTAAASAARSADALTRAGESAYVALTVIVVGGLVEGCALGMLQARALRPALGAAVARRWAMVTTVVAGVGWAAASAPAAFADQDAAASAPSLLLVLAAACALGAVMGLILGAVQGAVLRGHVTRPWRWAQVSALAWTPAMAVIFLGATVPSATWSTTAVVPLGAVTGLVAGTLLGVLSGSLLSVLDGVPVQNALLLRMLCSPLHRVFGGALLGLRVTGRVSGHLVEFPVQYAEDDAGLVVLPGHPERKRWWRNLRGGADVAVLVEGSWRPGRAVVLIDDEPQYAAAATTYRLRWPRVSLPQGQPLVRITLE